MTAPDRTTWTVAEDPNSGEDTLWRGDRSVIRHGDLYRVTTMQSDADDLFDVWVRVLAPDEATIERLAEAMRESEHQCVPPHVPWQEVHDRVRERYLAQARTCLAALTGTSAQARHTADEAVSGDA